MAVVGSRAYREAPEATSSLRLTTRRRRALHFAAIALASTACAVALRHGITVPYVIVSVAVATYGAGFGFGIAGISRRETLVAVPAAAAITMWLVAAACSLEEEALFVAAVSAMTASVMVGMPASLIGWMIGWPLRHARLVEPVAAPIAAPAPKKPLRRAEPHQFVAAREELPLDEVPDSVRPLVFAVRLRRRRSERERRRR